MRNLILLVGVIILLLTNLTSSEAKPLVSKLKSPAINYSTLIFASSNPTSFPFNQSNDQQSFEFNTTIHCNNVQSSFCFKTLQEPISRCNFFFKQIRTNLKQESNAAEQSNLLTILLHVIISPNAP